MAIDDIISDIDAGSVSETKSYSSHLSQTTLSQDDRINFQDTIAKKQSEKMLREADEILAD